MATRLNKVEISGVAGVVDQTDTFMAELKVDKEGIWLIAIDPDPKRRKARPQVWHFSPWDEIWFGSRGTDKVKSFKTMSESVKKRMNGNNKKEQPEKKQRGSVLVVKKKRVYESVINLDNTTDAIDNDDKVEQKKETKESTRA